MTSSQPPSPVAPWLRQLASVIAIAAVLFSAPALLAQDVLPSRVYPLGDYTLGKSLLFDGRTEEASHVFETAYRLSRTYGERHGIDAVPVLARNAQSLYHAGHLQTALSNAEAALELTYNSRYWTNYIRAQPFVLRQIDLGDGRIAWIDPYRPIRLADYPNAFPVVIGSELVLVESQTPNSPAVVQAQPILIDAIEVFLSQAIAMRVRDRVLGPVGSVTDLSTRLSQAYEDSSALPDLLAKCQGVCRGIALSTGGDAARAATVLQDNLSTNDKFDHPLTSIALLTLGDLAVRRSDYPAAAKFYGQASLLAARLQQIDLLADAVLSLCRVQDAIEPGVGSRTADSILRWTASRWSLAETTLHTAALESASLAGDAAATDLHARQLKRRLDSRLIQLPHLQAAGRLAEVRSMIRQNRIEQAHVQWREFVNAIGGRESLLPQTWQFAYLINLRSLDRVPVVRLTEMVDQLLASASDGQYIIEPWQTLAWESSLPTEVFQMTIGDAVRSQDADRLIRLVLAWQQRRMQATFPLDVRAAQIREALGAALPDVPPGELPAHERLLKGAFAAKIRQQELQDSRDSFLATAAVDVAEWTTDQHRTWQGFEPLASQQQKDLLTLATYPIAIRPQAGDRDPQLVYRSVGEGEIILLIEPISPNRWLCGQITAASSDFWMVEAPQQILTAASRVISLTGFGLDRPAARAAAEKIDDAFAAATAWTSTLLPGETAQRFSEAATIRIVASGEAAAMPFELLMDIGQPPRMAWWGLQHRLLYHDRLPTRPLSQQEPAEDRLTVVIQNEDAVHPTTAIRDELLAMLRNVLQERLAAATHYLTVTAKTPPAAIGFGIFAAQRVMVIGQPTLPLLQYASPIGGSSTLLHRAVGAAVHWPQDWFWLSGGSRLQAYFASGNDLQQWLWSHRLAGSRQLLLRTHGVPGGAEGTFAYELASRLTEGRPEEAIQQATAVMYSYDFAMPEEAAFTTPGNRVASDELIAGDRPLLWFGWRYYELPR